MGKIKLKLFSLGDLVYYMDNNKIAKGIVVGIRCDVIDSNIIESVGYTICKLNLDNSLVQYRRELTQEKVFKSKEELIKSL